MVQSSRVARGALVSLFTREWIEILDKGEWRRDTHVSLFTREWIEMGIETADHEHAASPSLRGSGLK